MQRMKRGHIKNKSYIYDRITVENMRRMLIAALSSAVLFFVIWTTLLLSKEETASANLYYVRMVLYPGISMIFAGTTFYFMANKQRNKMALVRAFWLFFLLEFGVVAFFVQNRMLMLLNMAVLAVVLSLVPLFDRVEFSISLGMQFGLSTLLCLLDRIDLEHFVYLISSQVLCGIISRQAYWAYLRKVEDATKLNSAKNQAETDPMTTLLNRRGLERRIACIWPMCIRQKMGAAVIMLDIDNFKKYNDYFGHPAGDECIKAVAKALLKHTKRKTDYCARVGGEEFLVFLTGLSAQDALLWAQECKKSFEEMMIPHAKDNFLPYVTISMGICYSEVHQGTEFWEMRNEADRSLYQAKEEGKACIFMGDKCYAKTTPELNRKQYYMERGFRSLG